MNTSLAIEKGFSALKPATKLKGAIKPETLGWVRPDSVIRFATEEAAENAGKNIVMKSFQAPVQYEKGVVISKNEILGIFNGNEGSAQICPELYGKKHIKFLHSHPDQYGKGKTTPISCSDFQMLRGKVVCNNNVDEVVAFNSNGEYSKLTKLCPQPKNWFEWLRYQYKYYKFEKLAQRNLYKKWSAKDYMQSLEELQKESYRAVIKKDYEKLFALSQQSMELQEAILKRKVGESDCKLIDAFWRRFAKKLGVKYETNYTSL